MLNQYDLPNIKTKRLLRIPKFSVLSSDEAIPAIPEIRDRKILRFTGFFNLLKSSAQSSEYLFKKLKIVILVFFIDKAVLQLITAQGSLTPKQTYHLLLTLDSGTCNFQYQYLSFIDRMTGELE